MFGDKKSPDDLINEKMEPIIIRQESSNDKKFIYIVMILLILLFIIALGVIAFLGSKYFKETETQVAKERKYLEPTTKEKQIVKEAIKKVNTPTITPKVKDETKALEELIAQDTNKQVMQLTNKSNNIAINSAISNIAPKNSDRKLSKEELAIIAKLVAQEISKNNKTTKTSNKIEGQTKDQKLVQSLEAAPTDTLDEQDLNTTKLKNSSKKVTKADKKVDTFNKVIIKEKKSGDDEFSKLTNEIDSILQSDDVKKVEANSKYNNTINKETDQREKELRFIVVKDGDTLGSIARRAYGKASEYKKIYEANPGLIQNPNRIFIGMKLRVPLN